MAYLAYCVKLFDRFFSIDDFAFVENYLFQCQQKGITSPEQRLQEMVSTTKSCCEVLKVSPRPLFTVLPAPLTFQPVDYSIKDEITAERLGEADLVIFGGPRDLFSVAEFKELKDWLNNGGRALVLLGDGGEKVTGCNLNYLLEEYVFS